MGSCSTKQEVVSHSSATATPVAIVLRPSGFTKGSKVHDSDSPFRTRVDSFRNRADSFRTRADSKSLIDAVSREIVKAGDKMKEKSVDGHKPKNDKIKHNTEKSGDNNKPNGTPNDGRVTKKSERKAMRIGDYALIVEIKDQGMKRSWNSIGYGELIYLQGRQLHPRSCCFRCQYGLICKGNILIF